MLSPPASSNICIWSHKCPERLCVQNLKSLQILTSVRSTLREAKHNRDNVNVKHTGKPTQGASQNFQTYTLNYTTLPYPKRCQKPPGFNKLLRTLIFAKYEPLYC